jgi:hypothetical protein
MLAICAAHARDAGISPTLHHADWLTLALERKYHTIYNPSGSFALIVDVDDARAALVTWREHLVPGGQLIVSSGVPGSDFDAEYEWRVRRSATRASDGVTFIVHEAVKIDADAQLHHDLNRHEVWDRDGQLVTTFMRRHTLRWWTREQFTEMLEECGYADVRTYGQDDGFFAVGHAPQ